MSARPRSPPNGGDDESSASGEPATIDGVPTSEGLLRRAVDNALRHPAAVYRLLWYVLLAFFLAAFLFPLYWLLVLAVTPPDAAYRIGLIPREVTAANFAFLLDPPGTASFGLYVLNSVLIAAAATALVLVVGSLAGYAFGRLDFPGRRPLLIALLCVAYFPPTAFLLPLFWLFTGNVELFGVPLLPVYNTHLAVVLPLGGFTLPLAIFILTAFYAQIPGGLEDAARVEGSTRLGALFRVIIPLSWPGVATAGVLTFISVYTEFLYSFLMTDGRVQSGAPIVPALLNLREVELTFAAAGSIIALVPVLLVLLLANDRIVRGLDTSTFV